MSVARFCTLLCNDCNDGHLHTMEDTAAMARVVGAKRGWTVATVKREKVDRCPACSRKAKRP